MTSPDKFMTLCEGLWLHLTTLWRHLTSLWRHLTSSESFSKSMKSPDNSVTFPDKSLTSPDKSLTSPDKSVTSPAKFMTSPESQWRHLEIYGSPGDLWHHLTSIRRYRTSLLCHLEVYDVTWKYMTSPENSITLPGGLLCFEGFEPPAYCVIAGGHTH